MSQNQQAKTSLKHAVARVLMIMVGVGFVSAPCKLAESPVARVQVPMEVTTVSVPLSQSGSAAAFQDASPAELERAVWRAAQQQHLHPALLFAVMKAESSFNPMVVSKAGAVGLMQLVPETAMRHGVQNLYDTNENVAGGARHLRYLLDRFHGNTRLALAAYNAGERKVDRYKQIPPYKETRHYVQKVLSYYRDYRKEARLVPFGERQQEGYTIRSL